MTLDRRHFLAGAAGASASLLAGCAAPASTLLPPLVGMPTQTLLPKGASPRIVVVGGGWGGLTVAKQLRLLAPQAEVVMLERNPVFFSCPLSNKWLIDVVDTSFLTHDYLRVSERHGYRFVQGEVLEVDRATRRVVTTQGQLDYDYLVIAAGIRYNYEALVRQRPPRRRCHQGALPGRLRAQCRTLRAQARAARLQGRRLGDEPAAAAAALPAQPYERACLVARHFKTNKIKGRVTILDHKPRIAPIGVGFKAAFEELYKDYITYVPNAQVQEVDPFNKRIKTSAGDMRFDHAVLMAPHRAADIAWKAGTVGTGADGKPSGWADVEPRRLHLRNDDRVYVIGDAVGAVSPTFRFYPKSGHVANSHGHIVAGYIAQRLAGKEPELKLPDNLCYMLVNGSPREAISVQFDYTVNAQGVIEQQQIDDNDRRAELVSENFRWAGLKFEDMLA
ncbi:NAD(P)/FAD-dependent oxidoreductase [Piscinibacter aquaticus]|uniref:NAD(P)/FAD-dependent oxidoreductase n=1 Tax=Piscinibacter aquaticus TaxID=392597 RepID=A0A5C6TQ65_9BURK|nr:NAD(P)/FAD-dependent oxidoreductase [Piscinibacter aquaticus]